MNRTRRAILLTSLALLLAACVGHPDERGLTYLGGNNGAIISFAGGVSGVDVAGADVALDVTPDAAPDAAHVDAESAFATSTDLAELSFDTVPLVVTSPDARFEVSPSVTVAHQKGRTPQSARARMAIAVSNVASRAFCGVEAVDVGFVDVDGNGQGTGVDRFVTASVGLVGDVASDTCLAPGETGWVFLLANPSPESITSVRIATIRASEADVVDPAAQFFASDTHRLEAGFAVELTNAGEEVAIVATSTSIYALLDDDGGVRWWSTFAADDDFIAVAPHESLTLNAHELVASAEPTRVRLHLAYASMEVGHVDVASADVTNVDAVDHERFIEEQLGARDGRQRHGLAH